MKRDVRPHFEVCPLCDRFKRAVIKRGSPLNPVSVADSGDLVAVDLFGSQAALPRTPLDAKYIVIITDLYRKYLVAMPVLDQTAHPVADLILRNWISVFGAPHRLLSDQRANLKSAFVTKFRKLWRIKKIRTAAYHQFGNSVCERVNLTITRGLAKLLNQRKLDNRDLALTSVVCAYNSSIHATIGFTLHRLTFGAECRLRSELFHDPTPADQTSASFA